MNVDANKIMDELVDKILDDKCPNGIKIDVTLDFNSVHCIVTLSNN